MPSHNELIAICIKRKGKPRFNTGEIKSLAARFGIVESLRDVADNLFVNFSKITDINACMEEFRNSGFTVEESKRNKQPQAEPKPTAKESVQSSDPPPDVPGLSNFTATKSVSFSCFPAGDSPIYSLISFFQKSGFCVLCQRSTVLVCQRCTDFYCSLECQLKDWHSHRFICFPIP